jgi:hypothetical protein
MVTVVRPVVVRLASSVTARSRAQRMLSTARPVMSMVCARARARRARGF